jgi:hypothetical protein
MVAQGWTGMLHIVNESFQKRLPSSYRDQVHDREGRFPAYCQSGLH